MLSADTRQLKALGNALRKSQPALYKETQRALRAVGETVRARAATKASWSTRIPPTLKVRVSGLNSVIVSAGGSAAPGAKPLEHAGAEGTFRHPVFGNRDVWVDQPARPFLHPAALERLQESAEAVAAALTVQVEKTLHGQDVFI